MDVMTNAEEMNRRIGLLKKCRENISSLALKKAQSIASYEKKLAVTMMKLRNGVEMDLDGVKVQNPQTTVMEKIARGICYSEKLTMETADALYKAEVVNMDALQAELNGFQSINRYIKEVV